MRKMDMQTQDAISDVYIKLLAATETIDMVLERMHKLAGFQEEAVKAKCWAAVAGGNRDARRVKHIRFTQRSELFECLRMLEEIDPETCNDKCL